MRKLLRACIVAAALGLVIPQVVSQEPEPVDRSDLWLEQFSAALERETPDRHTLRLAVALVMEMVDPSVLPDEPLDAATLVATLARKAEASERRGVPGPIIALGIRYDLARSLESGLLSEEPPFRRRLSWRRVREGDSESGGSGLGASGGLGGSGGSAGSGSGTGGGPRWRGSGE